MRNAIIVTLAVLIALGALVSCRTTESGSAKEVGFLAHPELLKKGTGEHSLLYYVKPGLDFKKYPKVLIRPTTIWTKGDSDLKDLSKKDRQILTDGLFKAIHEEVSKVKTVVTQPGPGVMEIRAAITEAEGAFVPLDVVTTVLPQAIIISGAVQLAAGTRGFAGAASIEMEARDSVTGEVLAAGVDRRIGGKTPEGMFSTWDDVKSAFRVWAERIRTVMTEENPD
jgi:hypothetical protein